MPSPRRVVSNVIIVVFLCAISIDAVPSTCKAHTRLKNWLDPALDSTGLWQQTWQLFAPEPDRLNTRLSAIITLKNGETVHWKSPDWQQMGAWEQFRKFRHAEYFDNIRLNSNKAGWKPLAKHLASEAERTNKNGKVERVALTRHWVEVPTPKHNEPLMPICGDWTNEESYEFFVWEAGE